jgi:hypothetical protein
MDTLHALWLDGRGLALWGEDATAAVSSRSQALRTARPHPFAVGANELAQACGGEPAEVILALPSVARSPLDSPELVRLRPRPTATLEPSLHPWRVPVTVLAPPQAVDFLSAEPGPGLDDVRLAASVRFFAALAEFAADLVERGRMVPTIQPDDQGYAARWLPLLQGPDATWVAQAAAALPPVCRATRNA